MTDTIQCDSSVEGSKQPSYDFDKLIRGITRDSVQRRLRRAPNLRRDGNVTVVLYVDGI